MQRAWRRQLEIMEALLAPSSELLCAAGGKSGPRRARAKRCDRDAIALQFTMKGITRAQHVGLGDRIDGEVLQVGQRTGEQKGRSTSSVLHVLRKEVGDGRQARHIRLHHR